MSSQYGSAMSAEQALGLATPAGATSTRARRLTQTWQVLTVTGDRIIDIRGFGDRTEAAARVGVPA